MRVMFLIQGFDVAASRYRVLQYIPYLEKLGVEAVVRCYPSCTSDYLRLLRQIPSFDCLFLQRKRFHGPLLNLVRRRARRIVYDFDDAVMYHNSTAPSAQSSTREKRFADIIRASDSVIAGNSFLAGQAQRYTDHVTTIPTSIDAARYRLKDYESAGDRVRLGWIGDHGSIHYLQRMNEVLDGLGRKYPQAQMDVICDTFFDCENLLIEKRMWNPVTEIEDLRRLDIGLMPLVDDPWSRGKCGLKLLQYYGVGVPAVCTPVGVNRDIVKDGVNGFTALTPEEWSEKLSVLIENPELRKTMGLRGRDLVMESFTLQANAPRFYRVLEEVLARSLAA
jgi:hypothetical protein